MVVQALRDRPFSRRLNPIGLKRSEAPSYHAGGLVTIPAKALAQFCSTPKAIAHGRSFSKEEGSRIKRIRSLSARERYS